MNQLMELPTAQQEAQDFAQWEQEIASPTPEMNNRDYFKPEEVGAVALADSVRIAAADSVRITASDSVRITAEDSVRITAQDDSVRITAQHADFGLVA